jgi:uncharacterized membrane protein HdeD (DUF308 family)
VGLVLFSAATENERSLYHLVESAFPMLSSSPPSSLLALPSPRRRIAATRAVAALVWAAALILAVGDDVPTTASDLPTLVALLLTVYPLIDAVSSAIEAAAGASRGSAFRLPLVNATLSAAASVALAVAAFGSDAGAVLAVFGVWASVSGALQLGVAIARRRAGSREVSMIVSGGLSTIAGVTFAAASAQHAAHLANLAGYAALGAVLFLVWAVRPASR